MRLLIQRVTTAKVTVGGEVVGEIDAGLMILLGIGKGDTETMLSAMAKKVTELRIFSDENDKMNRSIIDTGGSCLVVSQFTLYADCTGGRRPFFGNAEAPERANQLCEMF